MAITQPWDGSPCWWYDASPGSPLREIHVDQLTGEFSPHLTRLNRHFLLSDFMYNDSVIRRGAENYVDPATCTITAINRMRIMSDALVRLLGPVSVSYGYISPEFSRKHVKYMNPNDPSNHRWDKGQAADFTFHFHPSTPPVDLIRQIISAIPLARGIVYSESPYLCLSTGSDNMLAEPKVYINTYEGFHKRRPHRITLSSSKVRQCHEDSIPYEHQRDLLTELDPVYARIERVGWQGQGWPSYHLKGNMQTQHIRVGKYIMLSDCLHWAPSVDRAYCDPKRGAWNAKAIRPPVDDQGIAHFRRKAAVMDEILRTYYEGYEGPSRVSFVSAYKGHDLNISWSHDTMLDWEYDRTGWILGVSPVGASTLVEVIERMSANRHGCGFKHMRYDVRIVNNSRYISVRYQCE